MAVCAGSITDSADAAAEPYSRISAMIYLKNVLRMEIIMSSVISAGNVSNRNNVGQRPEVTGANTSKTDDNEKAVRKASGKRKTINAGNLNLMPHRDNLIDSKRIQVRKQAMKLISDAWASDDKVNKQIDEMNSKKQDMLNEMSEINKRLGDIEKQKEQYRLEYGVSEDSEEQKDLELLEKYQNNITGVANDEFTKEELDRLKQLQNEPLTEYQKKVLSLNGVAGNYKSDYSRLKVKVAAATGQIAQAKIDRDKSQGMLKADAAADDIIAAAEDEVFNILVEQGKENIDKKLEEDKEKAEKAEEKEEKLKEKLDKNKEERKKQKEIFEGEVKADKMQQDLGVKSKDISRVDDAMKQIDRIMQENKLINEDLKGIEIDFNF